MTEQPARPRTQITDPTGRHVARNVRRIREARGWSTYDLSRLLKDAGRPISPSAIAKVERAERRVDVGDLAALAAIFGVSPSALILPMTEKPGDQVDITGAGAVPAEDAWAWGNGARPLRYQDGKEPTQQMEHQLFGVPQWLRTTVQGPVRVGLTAEGTARTNAFREAFREAHGRLPNQNEVLNWLLGVQAEGGTGGQGLD